MYVVPVTIEFFIIVLLVYFEYPPSPTIPPTDVSPFTFTLSVTTYDTNLAAPYTPPTCELPLTFEFVTFTGAFASVLCSPASAPTYVSALILNLSIFIFFIIPPFIDPDKPI